MHPTCGPSRPLPATRFRRRLLLAVLLGCAVAACRTDAPAAPARPTVRIGTAFPPFSTRLIEEYRAALPQADVQSVPTPSSPATLRAIEEGTIDLGVALADDAYRSYTGGSAQPAGSGVRGISLLQPLPMYLLVRAGSGVRSVPDLRGKVVGVGPENTASWTLGHLILEAFGVEAGAVKALSGRQAAAAGLRDGSLDAIVLPGYVYPDDVTLGVISNGAYLVPIDGPAVDDLRRVSPFVRRVMIPRDIYPGQDQIIPTIGVDMVIVCRRDLPEDVAYQLTEQLFAVFPRLARIEATLRFLNLEDAPATPIPLHPGAARYYRQRELSR